MAGIVKERIRDWMRRKYPPMENYVRVFECHDVTQLLPDEARMSGLRSREGMIFASRDTAAPAPRKEIVILTRVLANYSAERIITILDRLAAKELTSSPSRQLLLDDDLGVRAWGPASTGPDAAEVEPCERPAAIPETAET